MIVKGIKHEEVEIEVTIPDLIESIREYFNIEGNVRHLVPGEFGVEKECLARVYFKNEPDWIEMKWSEPYVCIITYDENDIKLHDILCDLENVIHYIEEENRWKF